jgi:hypothetical protein
LRNSDCGFHNHALPHRPTPTEMLGRGPPGLGYCPARDSLGNRRLRRALYHGEVQRAKGNELSAKGKARRANSEARFGLLGMINPEDRDENSLFL